MRDGDRKTNEGGGVNNIAVGPRLAKLVRGKRGSAAGAIGDNLVALVEKALPCDLLQRPPDRLDISGIKSPVGVIKVNPEPDPLGEAVPLLDVAED